MVPLHASLYSLIAITPCDRSVAAGPSDALQCPLTPVLSSIQDTEASPEKIDAQASVHQIETPAAYVSRRQASEANHLSEPQMEPRLAELLARRRAVAEPSEPDNANDEEPSSSRVFSSSYRDSAQIAILSQAAEKRRLREEKNLQAADQVLSNKLQKALDYETAEKDKLKALLQTKARAERIRLLLMQALPEGLKADGSRLVDGDEVGAETPVSIRLAKIEEELAEVEIAREAMQDRLTQAVIAAEKIRGEREQVIGILAATRKRRDLMNRAAQLTNAPDRHEHVPAGQKHHDGSGARVMGRDEGGDNEGAQIEVLQHRGGVHARESPSGGATEAASRAQGERRDRPLTPQVKGIGGAGRQRPQPYELSLSRVAAEEARLESHTVTPTAESDVHASPRYGE